MPERSSRNAPREWERNNSSNSIWLILLNESGGHDWKLRRALLTYLTFRGRLAQLEERIVRNDEAGGSIPPPSTIIPLSSNAHWKRRNRVGRSSMDKPFSKLDHRPWPLPWGPRIISQVSPVLFFSHSPVWPASS